MISTSVVIPVYNGGKTLIELCYLIDFELNKLNLSYEIILIDDKSKDDSFEVMKIIRKENKNVKIIKLKKNYGQQNAILCGLRYSIGEYIITMDDDMQNPPSEIKKIIDKINEGYDIVYGIAEDREYSFYRNLGSKLTDILFNIICHKPRNKRVSSFRILKREIADEIILETSSFVYISAIILSFTKNIGNINVHHNIRKYGESNYKPFKLIKLFLKIFIYYSGLFGKINSKKVQYEIEEIDL
jgi:polyisoprenyl-phosphate glycosyltransferase